MTITNTSSNTPRPAAQPAAPRTPLQKHVDFFDRNGDRETTVCETYSGLRALGMGRIASGGAAFVINLGLAMKTGASWLSPLTVKNDNIHLAKHDSDSDTYDAQGHFDPARFEQMFTDFDTNKDSALDKAEIDVMLDTRKETFVGRQAAGAEFGLLLKLAGQERPVDGQPQPVLTRERLQSLYDGNLFYELAGETPPA